MINERKNCTAAPGGGGKEATVVKVGGISSSHQILCISSRPICSTLPPDLATCYLARPSLHIMQVREDRYCAEGMAYYCVVELLAEAHSLVRVRGTAGAF